MDKSNKTIHIVGAGLAGCESAFQLAEKGHYVKLYEMKALGLTSPAHKTHDFAELVCSNSFGSQTDYSAAGQLKWEAEKLNSIILKIAKKHSVPAGMALSVDRKKFSQSISQIIKEHPLITVVDKKIESLSEIPRPAIIATGPLTDKKLSKDLVKHFGNDFLYFFDAIAPIIDADTINTDIAWYGDRFDKGTKDYLNCPLNKEQYYQIINEIKNARKIEAKDFEKETIFFDGCMPIEEIIRRGDETPRHGPMSPKGLQNQGPEWKKYAVVQLRKENKEATAFNMVGFQTKMAYSEQIRIFKMIPGLEDADFLKLGSIHRNLYINSPKSLSPYLSSKIDDDLFFSGQITGVEGYFESTCIGLLVAKFLDDKLNNKAIQFPPRASAFGSLLNAITEEKDSFQPTNMNFSLLPRLSEPGYSGRRNKEKKRNQQIINAQMALNGFSL